MQFLAKKYFSDILQDDCIGHPTVLMKTPNLDDPQEELLG